MRSCSLVLKYRSKMSSRKKIRRSEKKRKQSIEVAEIVNSDDNPDVQSTSVQISKLKSRPTVQRTSVQSESKPRPHVKSTSEQPELKPRPSGSRQRIQSGNTSKIAKLFNKNDYPRAQPRFARTTP